MLMIRVGKQCVVALHAINIEHVPTCYATIIAMCVHNCVRMKAAFMTLSKLNFERVFSYEKCGNISSTFIVVS